MQVWRVDEGSWACLHETSHGFSVVTSLLYTGSMLYVAGVPDEASSWTETWRAGYGYAVDSGSDGGGGAVNATRYTIARMSQSPMRFRGKYETWGEGEGEGDGDDGGEEDEEASGKVTGAWGAGVRVHIVNVTGWQFERFSLDGLILVISGVT